MHKDMKQSVYVCTIQTCTVLQVGGVKLHGELECEVESIEHPIGHSV